VVSFPIFRSRIHGNGMDRMTRWITITNRMTVLDLLLSLSWLPHSPCTFSDYSQPSNRVHGRKAFKSHWVGGSDLRHTPDCSHICEEALRLFFQPVSTFQFDTTLLPTFLPQLVQLVWVGFGRLWSPALIGEWDGWLDGITGAIAPSPLVQGDTLGWLAG
jgi:hypothetical protein